MATTSAGNPYVESSDLVANYPATSLALANRLDKYAVNPFADAAARDAAIPTPVQGQLAQTLDDNKVWRYDGTAWSPFSGAVGAANFTDTATGTYSSGGIDYKYITYTGTGSITIDQAGFASILVLGAGGSGGTGIGSGGGAGAYLYIEDAFFPAATHTVVVGAGGAGKPYAYNPIGGSPGESSRVGDYLSPGGGAGVAQIFNGSLYESDAGNAGGSGSGASGKESTGAGNSGGSGLIGYGSDGGLVNSAISNAAAGGGGASSGIPGRGVPPAVNGTGGDGGAGQQSTIRNTTVFMCGGGGGSGSLSASSGGSGVGGYGAGTTGDGGPASPNTGSGGGGAYQSSVGVVAGNGGSGIVIVRVVV